MSEPSDAKREQLHRLVDDLPDDECHAARRYLEYLRSAGGPLRRRFSEAPEDDEPLTPEEAAAIDEAMAELRRGDTVPASEIEREFVS